MWAWVWGSPNTKLGHLSRVSGHIPVIAGAREGTRREERVAEVGSLRESWRRPQPDKDLAQTCHASLARKQVMEANASLEVLPPRPQLTAAPPLTWEKISFKRHECRAVCLHVKGIRSNIYGAQTTCWVYPVGAQTWSKT